MTMEPTDTRASTQGDKGQPFRPQRNVIFERARRMQTPVTRARAHACAQIACCTPISIASARAALWRCGPLDLLSVPAGLQNVAHVLAASRGRLCFAHRERCRLTSHNMHNVQSFGLKYSFYTVHCGIPIRARRCQRGCGRRGLRNLASWAVTHGEPGGR